METDTLTHKRCSLCEEHKLTTEFYKDRRSRDGLFYYCKPCSLQKQRDWHVSNPLMSIFSDKRSRAKQRGIEFDLVFEDVEFPARCPVLGIELNYTRCSGLGRNPRPNSPSFDRIDPDKGYVKGNVLIVSMMANQIKSNATVEQLEKVASFYRQLIPQTGVSHVPEAN